MQAQRKDLSSYKSINRVAHRRDVTGVSFNFDGSFLAAAGDGSTTVVFDVERSAPFALSVEHIHSCSGHSKNIECVKWHPSDPKVLATVGMDKLLNVYDLRKGPNAVRSISAEHGFLKVTWAPDGSRTMLASDCEDNLYRVDTTTTTLTTTSAIKLNAEINEFAWGSALNRLYVARGDGRVSVLRWPTLERITVVDAHTERCFAVAVDPNERYFAVTSEDASVSVWHAESLSNLYTSDRFEAVVRLAAYSHDSDILALADEKSGIQLTSARSGAPLHVIPTSGTVNCIDWHPSHRLLAYSLDRSNREERDSAPNFNVWGYT